MLRQCLAHDRGFTNICWTSEQNFYGVYVASVSLHKSSACAFTCCSTLVDNLRSHSVKISLQFEFNPRIQINMGMWYKFSRQMSFMTLKAQVKQTYFIISLWWNSLWGMSFYNTLLMSVWPLGVPALWRLNLTLCFIELLTLVSYFCLIISSKPTAHMGQTTPDLPVFKYSTLILSFILKYVLFLWILELSHIFL